MKDEYAFPDIVGEEVELKPKASSKYRNYWERFKNLVRRINMRGVSGDLHFHDSSNDSWQAFKETFDITNVRENCSSDEIYESGDVNIYGIRMKVYSPHRKDPDYVPPTHEQSIAELARDAAERRERVFMNSEVLKAFWELTVKGLIEVDNDLMKAALDDNISRNWEYMLAKAKIHYSEVIE